MAVSHVFSATVADWTGTITNFDSRGSTQTVAATNLVRPSDWDSAHNQYYTLTGNTTNASTASATNVIFSGGNNITLRGDGASVGIQGEGPPSISRWQNYHQGFGRTDSAPNWYGQGTSQSSLYVIPLDLDGDAWHGNMTISSMFVGVSGSISGAASTAAKTYSLFIGIYTENASSLSLLNSVSASVGSGAANANMTASFNGARLFSLVSSAWSVQPVLRDGSFYYIGFMMQSAGESFAMSWRGQPFGVSGQWSGTVGSSIAATATTMKSSPWYGMYTAQTAALPTVISQAHLRGTASGDMFAPIIRLENLMSSY